jgi:hypothetical protein
MSDVNQILNLCGLCRRTEGGGLLDFERLNKAGRDFDAGLEQRARKHEREFVLNVHATTQRGEKEVRLEIRMQNEWCDDAERSRGQLSDGMDRARSNLTSKKINSSLIARWGTWKYDVHCMI